MTVADTAGVSPGETELLRRAADLVPVLRERAADAEQLRQLPDTTLQDLHDSGLFEIATPARYGGNGHEIDLMYRVAMELGRGCGSTAWCYAVWSTHSWMLGHWPQAAQEEYFATGPRTLSSSSLGPCGRLEPVAGGFRLTARGEFSSGSDAATWVLLGATGPEGYSFVLLPRPDYRVIDTWFVAGLSGTGSKDIEVCDAFVPAHRVVSVASLSTASTPGWDLHRRASYRVPLRSLLHYTLAAPLVGMAQHAIEEFVRRLRGTSGPGRTADSVALQLRLAESAAEADTARLLVAHNTAEQIARATTEERIDLGELAPYLRDHAYVAKLCVQSVTRLFDASGGHSVYSSEPMQRIFRDVQTAAHHFSLSWDLAGEAYGRVALGLPPLAPRGSDTPPRGD